MTTTFSSHCPSDRAETLPQTQFTVNHVGATTCLTSGDPGPGLRRGVVCFMHPSQASDLPMPFNGLGWGIFGSFDNVFTDAAVADGWVVDLPAYPADWSIDGVGHIQNFYNSIIADPGVGLAVIAAYVTWWDHYNLYLQDRFGVIPPVVIGGFSMGAWTSAVIAANAVNNPPVGLFCHALPTIWEAIAAGPAEVGASGLAPPPAGSNANLGPHALDLLTMPMIVGYSNTDNTVGWSLSGAPYGTVSSNVDGIITNAQAAGANMTRFESAVDENNTGPSNPPVFAKGGGHIFAPQDAQVYIAPTGFTGTPAAITTPALTTGWFQAFIDPSVPPNTF